MDKIVIIGAGGHARAVLDVIEAIQLSDNSIECIGFVVDREYGEPGTMVNGLPILGDIQWLVAAKRNIYAVCAIGAPHLRYGMIRRVEDAGLKFRSLAHPKAIMTKRITIGEGSIVQAGCVLSNNIVIGRHVYIASTCVVGHDVIIGDFVQVSPGCHIAGYVNVGEGCFMGTGANIVDRIIIDQWSRVGAGSTIIKDVEPNTTVVGCPGKVVKHLEKDWHLGNV